MDEKLTKLQIIGLHAELFDILAGRAHEGAFRNAESIRRWVDTVIPKIEQAFRDDGWIEPQQPAEGELVDYCSGCQIDSKSNTEGFCDRSRDCDVAITAKAQLAHDKATMVKLPSEDELERLIDQAILISYNDYTKYLEDEHKPISKGQALLKLLQEKGA